MASKYKIKQKKWNHLEPGHPHNKKTYNICGARKRWAEDKGWTGQDVYCQQPAGKQTHHLGVGRCHLHGGGSKARLETIVHGRRSMAFQDELRRAYIEKANLDELDGDPLDLRAELSVQRDLLYIFLSRYGKGLGLELDDLPLSDEGWRKLEQMSKDEHMPMREAIEIIYAMVKDISRVTQAITSQRKDIIMSMTEIHRQAQKLQSAVELTFEEFIDDPEVREKAVQRFIARSGSLLPSG